ncbi:MAG: asparagine synthase (glutamine-hydrolyzing) [Clostridia bacterium]|nr:asparagine synthase (glutamine-hydrolyzing) [Clostridia bacterium]
MCGICGYMQEKKITNNDTIFKMQKSILRRGNSENNIYVNNNVALGHARLSIIDIKNGKQPMEKNINGKKYTIVYNGEIYNTNVLRNILITKGYIFDTECDTEVLLLLYIEFKEKMLKFINGIFAFAIYDEKDSSIFVAKDRLGVKPLFYTLTKDKFIFSSEVKGILASEMIAPTMGKDELLELLALGPAHTPGKTYFKDILELQAGHYGIYKDNELKITKYWDLEEKKMFDSDEDILDNVKYLVTDATKKQIVSDVGVSTMLSGGLDSSIVTKIVSDNVHNVRTYSINYENNDKDFVANSYQQTKDSDFVKVMVKYLNTKHSDIIVTDKDLFSNLYEAVIARDMPGMADIDSSMYVFCKAISDNNEKVVLSGECSDEIFGGYPWFYKEHLKQAKGFPWALSENLRENLLKDGILDKSEIFSYILKSKKDTLKNVTHISSDSFENEYKELNYLTIKYFMNTLIERTDRMSMRTSLEVRVPYADHRIFEYVYNVDAKLKLGLRNGDNVVEKYILKQAFKNDIPTDITNRKKSPFPKTYSKEYLKLLEEKLTQIIDEPTSRIHEIINVDYVRNLIATHGEELTENLFGQLMTYPQTLAFLIQIDYWLTAYNVQIKL